MEENQFVVFKLKDEEYAIDIIKTHEVNRLKEITITKVPKLPDFIEGIINLRGDVVPIVNLRKKFSLPSKIIDKKTRIVIVKVDNKFIGLLVDSVSNVLSFQEVEISPPPDEVKMNCEYILGLGKKENRIVFLLDIDKILSINEQILINPNKEDITIG